MRIIYNTTIYLLKFICFVLSFFDKKIGLMYKGQRETFFKLKEINKNDKVAWFHCASLGEFEQVRNLMENFKNKIIQIILKFI